MGNHWLFSSASSSKARAPWDCYHVWKHLGFLLWECCVCQAQRAQRHRFTELSHCDCILDIDQVCNQRIFGSNFIHWSVTMKEIVFLSCTTSLLESVITLRRPSLTPVHGMLWNNCVRGKTPGDRHTRAVETREFLWLALLFLSFESCNQRGVYRAPEIKLPGTTLTYNGAVTCLVSALHPRRECSQKSALETLYLNVLLCNPSLKLIVISCTM